MNSEETGQISVIKRSSGGIFYVQTMGGFKSRLGTPTYLPGNLEATKKLGKSFQSLFYMAKK